MRLHKGCITDREAKELWRDYQSVKEEGNPLGLSFVEYVMVRVAARQPDLPTTTRTDDAQWYAATCGHQHPWGATCSDWSATT